MPKSRIALLSLAVLLFSLALGYTSALLTQRYSRSHLEYRYDDCLNKHESYRGMDCKKVIVGAGGWPFTSVEFLADGSTRSLYANYTLGIEFEGGSEGPHGEQIIYNTVFLSLPYFLILMLVLKLMSRKQVANYSSI